MEISRVTHEIRKLEVGDVSVDPSKILKKAIPNFQVFKDLPSLSEIPPATIPRAAPTATAAAFEERQHRIAEVHDAVRRRLEISRKSIADGIVAEIKTRHHADRLLATTPMNVDDCARIYAEDDTLFRAYF